MSSSKIIQDATLNGWKSERLIYRALQDDEADHTFMHQAIAGDPAGFPMAYSEAFRPQSKQMTAALFSMLLKKSLSVVICLAPAIKAKATGEIETSQPEMPRAEDGCGNKGPALVPIGILTLTAPDAECHHHRKTMLGISIIDAYQGKGYGSEAINWSLDWAFKFGGMHRVGLTCYGYNHRGQRLYERLGFVKEGTVRQCLWFNRSWHDEIYYGMLESEWEVLRQRVE